MIDTPLIVIVVVCPCSCALGLYRFFNHGALPCLDMSGVDNRVYAITDPPSLGNIVKTEVLNR